MLMEIVQPVFGRDKWYKRDTGIFTQVIA